MTAEAHQIIYGQELLEKFEHYKRIGMLAAKCAILGYRTHPQQSLADARALKDPFYASLALGGIAAILQKSNPEHSEKLYTEAEQRAFQIRYWSDGDATSLGYLYQLIPAYDSQRARRLWERAAPPLVKWDDYGHRSSAAMRELSAITVQVAPEKVEEFQQTYIAGKHHYWASDEILTRASFKQSPAAAREKLNQQTAKGLSTYNDRALWRAVLADDAARDYRTAFAWVKDLKTSDWHRSHARLTALYDLVLILLNTGRSTEAGEVADYLEQEARIHDEAFHKDNDTTGFMSSVRRLRHEMESGGYPPGKTIAISDTLDDFSKARRAGTPVFTTTPDEVDEFLKKPEVQQRMYGGIAVLESPWIELRDDAQAAKLIAAASPLADKIAGDGGFHGSPRSTSLGVLALIECARGNWQQANNLIQQITIPDLKAFYLMEALKMAHPLPEAVNTWPLEYSHSPAITIGASSSP